MSDEGATMAEQRQQPARASGTEHPEAERQRQQQQEREQQQEERAKQRAASTPKQAEPLEHDAAVEAVKQSLEEDAEDVTEIAAEQLATGHAAPMLPSRFQSREEVERRAHEAMGLVPSAEDQAAAATSGAGGGTSVTVETAGARTRRLEGLAPLPGDPGYEDGRRSGRPGGPAGMATLAGGETRSVIIDATAYIVPVGEDVQVPRAVADVLKQADRPLRTKQMLGEGGLRTVDLRTRPGD
jgi:hypothetical protein